jgi:hypothetical protein
MDQTSLKGKAFKSRFKSRLLSRPSDPSRSTNQSSLSPLLPMGDGLTVVNKPLSPKKKFSNPKLSLRILKSPNTFVIQDLQRQSGMLHYSNTLRSLHETKSKTSIH